MGVRFFLEDDGVRIECLEIRCPGFAPCTNPDFIVGPWLHGEIYAVSRAFSFAYLIYKASAGKQRATSFMDGDCQNIGIIVEQLLNAISVVDIDIHVTHARKM